MKAKLLTLFLLAITTIANAQLAYQWAANPQDSYIGKDIKTGPNGEVYYLERTSPEESFTNFARLSRLNPATGVPLWTLTLTGPGACYPEKAAVDGDGNVIIIGEFADTIHFDPSSFAGDLYSPGGSDAFIAKYNSSGDFMWAKRLGAYPDSYIAGLGIATDTDNSICITGYYFGMVDFDPSANTVDLTSYVGTENDIFVAKYDFSGDYLWAFSMGSSSSTNRGNAIVTDSLNNVYITGGFTNVVDFDPGPDTHSEGSQGSLDIFMAKYDVNGSYIWSKAMGSPQMDIGNGIALNSQNDIYITGSYSGAADMDPTGFMLTLEVFGGRDFFLAKYDNNSNLLGAQGFGSNLNDDGYAVVVDADDSPIITGAFSNSVDFSSDSSQIYLTANGLTQDIFIAKYDSGGFYKYAKAISGTDDDIGYALAYSDSSLYIAGRITNAVDMDFGPAMAQLISTGGWDAFYGKYTDKRYDAEILTFSIPNEALPAVVDSATQTIHATMWIGTILSALSPNITISPQATINPASGTPQDFNNPFTYTVTSFDGQVVKDWIVTVTTLHIGVNENLAKQISLYPNPANGLLNINTGTLHDVDFQLCDIAGRVLFTQQLTNTTSQVDVSGFASGVYLGRLFYKGEFIGVKKVVVE
jgi:hypothetical protein